MRSYSGSKLWFYLFIAFNFILSIYIGQAVSLHIHRNQTEFVLKSVLNSTVFQERSPNFESYLRTLFSALRTDNDPDHLTVILCHEGEVVASAPRWIQTSFPSQCSQPQSDSLRRFEIREMLSTPGPSVLAIVHNELSPLNAYAIEVTLFLWMIITIFFLISDRLKFERRRISSVLERLENSLFVPGPTPAGNSAHKIPGWSANAAKILETRITSLKSAIERNQKEYASSKSEAEVWRIAQHAAHDIRAPLTVIDFVSRSLFQLPEAERVLLRKAIQRFREIADELLYLGKTPQPKSKNASLPCNTNLNIYSLQGIVQEIVSEKIVQFKTSSGLKLFVKTDAAQYGKFVSVQAGLLKRVLSNVINNSADAMNLRGEIEISLHESISTSGQKLTVRVRDNGPGIPKKLLSQLGKVQITYGKSEGQGLGLIHAKETLESWQGEMQIRSQPGQGTEVDLIIPEVPAPNWFCLEINLPADTTSVILDDDPLIHSIWEQRLANHSSPKVREQSPIHFSSGADASRWLELNPGAQNLFLFDLELAGENESGMDLIERYGLGKNSILVTSQYEDIHLVERCIRQGTKLLPKILAPIVPIHVESSTKPGLEGIIDAPCDAVLVDDDDSIREVWSFYAKEAGKRLRTFVCAEDFLKIAKDFSLDTVIFLDVNLNTGISGIEAAKKLRMLGFNQIGLATGSPKEDFQLMPWIDFVIDKTPPWISTEGHRLH